jgi:RNA polymerase primary sigma factor
MLKSIADKGLSQYLEEVGQHPLLDKKKEFALARKIRKEHDENAKEELILSNLRIVVYIAKKFRNQGLTLPELVNAGNEGLIRAAEKFDERKGYRFSTYSVWWIKRAIYKAVNQGKVIVPGSFLARRIQSFTNKFIRIHGREPTVRELSIKLKADQNAISLALTELIPPYSLDETFDDVSSPFIESVRLDIERADNLISPPPEEIFKKKVEREKIDKALKKLSSREQEVIKRNFGLGNYDIQTLEDISKLMNITRERVRQIKENALRKLKLTLLSQK